MVDGGELEELGVQFVVVYGLGNGAWVGVGAETEGEEAEAVEEEEGEGAGQREEGAVEEVSYQEEGGDFDDEESECCGGQ